MRCIHCNHPAVMWDWIAGLGDKWDMTIFNYEQRNTKQ
jgi:hypothetical protein